MTTTPIIPFCPHLKSVLPDLGNALVLKVSSDMISTLKQVAVRHAVRTSNLTHVYLLTSASRFLEPAPKTSFRAITHIDHNTELYQLSRALEAGTRSG
jgi:hypothetical protein